MMMMMMRRFAFSPPSRRQHLGRRSSPAHAAPSRRRLAYSCRTPLLARRDDVVVPGASSEYGSLGGDHFRAPAGGKRRGANPAAPALPWQAAHNVDVQRATQKAIVYELSQQQSRTLESVVPWFLSVMPPSYFRQVPEKFRNDHVKAIAAVKDANMDLYLNLKAQLPDGRQVLTYVRPSTEPGTLLRMVEELPWQAAASGQADAGAGGAGNGYVPLTRILVFSSKDESMSLNMFVYGTKQPPPPSSPAASPSSPAESEDWAGESGATSDRWEGHEAASAILEYAARVQSGDDPDGTGLDPHPNYEQDSLRRFLSSCTDNYVNAGSADPRRFLQQRNLFAQVSGTEGTRVHIEAAVLDEDEAGQSLSPPPGRGFHLAPDHYWVDVAVANSLPQVALENLCRLLFLHELDVTRARLDIVGDGGNGSVTMLRMLVAPVVVDRANGTNGASSNGNGGPAARSQPSPPPPMSPGAVFPLLALELRRVKWLDPRTMELVFRKHPHLGVARGEIVTALVGLVHAAHARDNPIAYSNQNIYDTVTSASVIGHATAVADLFLDRFDPDSPLPAGEFEERCAGLSERIRSDVEDAITEDMLLKMIDAVRHTLKTNVYMPDRYALGLRLDPRLLSSRGGGGGGGGGATAPPLPYGIVFVHGRRFNAFHVRFRDIARGGLRLVTPRSQELYALESARQYDECYGLALAQQLKNKDIPEGGSKAVALINTLGLSESARNFVMRKSVKAFADTVLDLIVQTDETRDNIVDLLGKKEVLYLGPDEQVIPDDINWIIRRAACRGYDTPAAFMSSKPRAGINHKEYGVTSEGVNVYLDVALRRTLGIDPRRDGFTVKITGGPDGDVAGNEMKILIREYGPKARIVGVADASGCAEDPAGLDQDELMRLFRAGVPISGFDRARLGPGGALHAADTPEGAKARNTMHNRLRADAFVPCGGRPGTIDATNYRQFLDPETGAPSSPLVVEGANLFITGDARRALFDEAGVVIVKDSSANKGGVITSSYEICAAMLLDEETFFQNKPAIVAEVLDKLRGLAKLEAELLFREFESFGGSLPDASQVISDCINATTDALSAALDQLSEKDRDALLPLFRAHLPKTLADLAFDHVHERVPDQYIKNAISSCLASRLVYKEGTRFIAAQPKERLAEVALRYVEKEKEVCALMEAVSRAENISDEEKARVLRLLDVGGARAALGAF